MTKPIVRWTIGDVRPDGFDCLKWSVESFLKFYDAEAVVCFNCPPDRLPELPARLVDQHEYAACCRAKAKGVAWKLYPPRLDLTRHELLIDNDIVFNGRVEMIDRFLGSDCTLLMEDVNRTYGRFECFVPPGYRINSGVFGMPPGFDLQKYVDFHVRDEWEKNALGEHEANETFDEQGLVASALLTYPRFVIIPGTSITNCEHHLVEGSALHFVGLNRRSFHRPYHLYRSRSVKLFL